MLNGKMNSALDGNITSMIYTQLSAKPSYSHQRLVLRALTNKQDTISGSCSFVHPHNASIFPLSPRVCARVCF